MRKRKFKVGDWVKRINDANEHTDGSRFEVGQIARVIGYEESNLPIVDIFRGGNDPDNLELYIPTKLEKALK